MPRFDLFLRRCLAAVRAFSRIPVPASNLQPADTAACARHWPGVGLVLGMAAAFVFVLVSLPLPASALSPLVAAVGGTGMTALLTDARHEKDLLRATGTAGLVLVLAGKLALLGVLGTVSPAGVLAALLGANAVSRLWALLLAWSLPSATPVRDGDHPLHQPAERSGLAAALAWCVVPLGLVAFAGGAVFLLLALLASALAFGWLRRQAQRGAGGVTLEAVGAAQQLCELAFYLGSAFGVPR